MKKSPSVQLTSQHLAQLNQRLLAQGWQLSPARWLAISDLLLNLPPHLTEDRFNTYQHLIGPLVCQSPEDQQQFRSLFEAWCSQCVFSESSTYHQSFSSNPNTPNDASCSGSQSDSSSPQESTGETFAKQSFQGSQHNFRDKIGAVLKKNLILLILFSFLLTISVIVDTKWIEWNPFVEVITQVVAPQPTSSPLSTVEPTPAVNNIQSPDPVATPNPTVSLQTVFTIPVDVAEEDPATPFGLLHWIEKLAYKDVIFYALPLSVLFWFLYSGCTLWLKTYVLTSKRSHLPYKTLTFELDTDSGGVEPLLIKPPTPRVKTTKRLNWSKTLEKTLRHLTAFSPVYYDRRLPPAFLVLLENHHDSHPQSAISEHLIKRLKASGFDIYDYRFETDTLTGYSNQPLAHTGLPQRYSLQALYQQHPDAGLMIISSTESAFLPVTQQCQPWLQETEVWTERLWITPQAQPWGYQQEQLAKQGFLISPLTGQGLEKALALLSEHVASDGSDHQSHWIQGFNNEWYPESFELERDQWLSELAPENEEGTRRLERLVQSLGVYLDKKGLLLLYGCALYPELHAYITLCLERALFADCSPSEREQRLLKLSRLPWFQHGRIPLYLRHYFVEQMTTNEYQKVYRVYQSLSVADEPNGPSFKGYVLDPTKKTSSKTPIRVNKDLLMVKALQGLRWRKPRLDIVLPKKLLHQMQWQVKTREDYLWQGLISLVMAMTLSVGIVLYQTTQDASNTETLDIPIVAMVKIPAGTFMMGCLVNDDDCEDDEKPEHQVTLNAFEISVTEVTFEQYDAYCDPIASCERPSDEGWGRGGRPVINVSWHDAQAYIQWLNEKTGQNYRLPTEAEWEYAARAGNETKYSWGNQPQGNQANGGNKEVWESMGAANDWDNRWTEWPEDGFMNTAPVGRYPANAFGLYDMHGNVREWVHDRYDENYYAKSPQQNPSGPNDPNFPYRVLRGGSWSFYAQILRSANRLRDEPEDREVNVGFRLASGELPAATPTLTPEPELTIPLPRMVSIPAGRFQMGCLSNTDVCGDNEKPVHEVSMSAFKMSATEVTFEQYDFYCDRVERCNKPSDEDWGRGTRPVINVSWHDAQAYIQWLNQQTGQRYRLPTEAEWEYAARAGTQTQYVWGNEIGSNNANCDGCGSQWDNRQTSPVKSFSPNPWGLFDMQGNVWEWVQDRYDKNYYANSSIQDPSGPSDPSFNSRVLRGGSWNDAALSLRSAHRDWNTPDFRGNYFGFRLSLDE